MNLRASSKALKVIASLLLGVAITIAVAWTAGAAITRAGRTQPVPAIWPGPTPPSWPADPRKTAQAIGERATGVGWTHVFVSAAEDPHMQRIYAFERLAVGWPWRAFSADSLEVRAPSVDSGQRQSVPIPLWRGGVRLTQQSGLRSERILPLAPVWPGFALNAILYASVVYAGFRLVRVVRSIEPYPVPVPNMGSEHRQ